MPLESTWTAVVLAAGKGTRMHSEQPKVLHRLLGRPMLAWVLDAAREAGASRLVVVVGHEREKIQAEISPEFPEARWAVQEEQLGTGHAVACARDAVALEDPSAQVLVLVGDCPLLEGETLADFLNAHAGSRAGASVLSFLAEDPAGYGRIVRGADGILERIVEHRDASEEELLIREVSSGIFALPALDLFQALEGLSRDNAQGELYLPDIVPLLRRKGAVVRAHLGADPVQFRGINHRAELAELASHLRRRLNHGLMLSGVGMEDPSSIYVDHGVSVGADTTLSPGVKLEGRTRIGTGCSIGHGSVLRDCELGAGAVVDEYCVLEGARMEGGARVGPFVHLRPGADIGRAARVGNFVEVKNTRIGERSKANHLAYLGDAELGTDVNVGAGTITCNYDGHRKNRTRVGDGVFIGSNSTLVAPIDVGDGSYVAAGSTVSRHIPPRSLAIGRARQVNKEGYRDVLDRRFGGPKDGPEED